MPAHRRQPLFASSTHKTPVRDRTRILGQTPSIYTHPIGFHGHAAGPTIGMWDQQEGVPIQGDYPLYHDTAYSIELNVTVPIPEWNGAKIRIMLEEDALFTQQGIHFHRRSADCASFD